MSLLFCVILFYRFVPDPVLFYLHPQAAEAVVSREGGSFQQVKCVPLRCVPRGFFVSLRMDFGCCRGLRPQARNPRATRAYIMEESSTQSRGRVKGQCPLENLQIPLAKRGKCGYNEWECARMGTAQDKPWKASRGGCEPGQDCLMANHPGARFSEARRAERAEVRRSG